MIRKNEIAVINVYLNGHLIDKVYSGQILVFPDQQIENNFWLHVYKSDNTDVFCWCRLLSAVETDGHITSITYEVIQTQSTWPAEDYYILNNAVIRKKSTSSGYDDVETTNGLDPDEVYNLIPLINEEIVVEFIKKVYRYGLYINNMEGVYFGAGKTTDYDKMEFFFRPVNYGGASWFGVMNAPGDNNDFRLFGSGSYIYFDCGSGRIYNTRITDSYMLKITLVSGGTCTQYYYDGNDHLGKLGTSGSFSNYTGSSKDILFGANAMYFYGFNGYNGGLLIDSIIVPESYVEQGIYNKLYNSVKKLYITLSKTPASYQTNSYPYSIGEDHRADGNILNDFSLSQETYTETVNSDVYTYRKVNVYNPLSEIYYDTGAKYVVSAVQYTEDPTIFYDETTMRVQAYGNGTVNLYIDGTLVQNPYFFVLPEQTTSYTVTATALESGKLISNTVSQIITIRGSSVTPVFVKISDASEVNSGECDIIVVCDNFGVALDGTKVTAASNGISVTIQQDGTIENSSSIANAVLHYSPSTLALTNVNGEYLGGNLSGAGWGHLYPVQGSAQYLIVISNNENKDNRPVVGNNRQTNRALLFNNQDTTLTLSARYYFRWYTKTQAELPGTANSTYWPVYIYKLQS